MSKRLVIFSALLALASYVSKEIVTEHVKGLHDSIEKVEAQFDNANSQSNLSIQAVTMQQQLEALKIQIDPKAKDPKRDFSSDI